MSTKIVRCSGTRGKECKFENEDRHMIRVGRKRFCSRCFNIYKKSLWRFVPDIYGPLGLNWITQEELDAKDVDG